MRLSCLWFGGEAMTPELIARLNMLADLDARAGEPLGKCMREAAAEIERLAGKVELAQQWRDADRDKARAAVDLVSALRGAHIEFPNRKQNDAFYSAIAAIVKASQ